VLDDRSVPAKTSDRKTAEATRMPLTRMEHFLVLTDDIEKTKNFYCDVLGMQVGFRPPLKFDGYWVYLGEVPVIHIGEWKTYTKHSEELGIPVTKPAPGTGPFDHIAFNGVDFEEIAARLMKHGVKAGLNVVPGNSLRQLFFNDPNGIKIEINITG
jgi:catechol 2,3-dioxygenase-like lactoylglutathione lyase family enzyme